MARTHPTPGLAACWCEEPEPPRRVRRVLAGMMGGLWGGVCGGGCGRVAGSARCRDTCLAPLSAARWACGRAAESGAERMCCMTANGLVQRKVVKRRRKEQVRGTT